MLVSGDVYDRALPSPDTVELLSDGVTRLIDAGATVILSSGNHDSAIRLGFASDLWPGRDFTSGPAWTRWVCPW